MTTIASPYFMGERMHGFAVPMPHTTLVPDFPDGDPQHRMASLYGYLATPPSRTPSCTQATA
jgi:hypothetical protein